MNLTYEQFKVSTRWCPICAEPVDPLGPAWKCQGYITHYFNVYPICGECGYTTMYIGHAPGCAQDDGG